MHALNAMGKLLSRAGARVLKGTHMLRPTSPADREPLWKIAEATRVFRPLELDVLNEVIDDYFKLPEEAGDQALTYELEGKPVGFVYYAPTPMTDRTWHLYWIFVDPTIHAKGLGTLMLKHVENELKAGGARILLIETSSLPIYDLTRKFYLKHGYEEAAIIKDFYIEGDDQVTYRKRLN